MKTESINEEQMLEILDGACEGSTVSLTYEAGDMRTDKAKMDAERSVREGVGKNYHFGPLTKIWKNKNGKFVFSVFTDTRDTIKPDGTITRGNYRTYNPSLGKLTSLSVVSKKTN